MGEAHERIGAQRPLEPRRKDRRVAAVGGGLDLPDQALFAGLRRRPRRLLSDLGLGEPLSLAEGFRRTAEWFRRRA